MNLRVWMLWTALPLISSPVWAGDANVCPEQFQAFLARFETDTQFQASSVRFPLRMAYVDARAEPEPKRKTKRVTREEFVKSQHPYYPTRDLQTERKLTKKITDTSSSARIVRFDKPDSDAYSIEYHFKKEGKCWRLTFLDDQSL